MFIFNVSELGGTVVPASQQGKKPETTVQKGVSTFVSLKPLDMMRLCDKTTGNKPTYIANIYLGSWVVSAAGPNQIITQTQLIKVSNPGSLKSRTPCQIPAAVQQTCSELLD